MTGRVNASRVERHGAPVAWLEVDRRDRLNILSTPLIEALTAEIAGLGGSGVRAAVLTGAGDRAFVGGADIHEMAGLEPASARAFITGLHRLCAAVRDAPVPVVARIEGHCYGAGLELAAACDLRVAAEGASFGMPEVHVGIPSVIEAALLPGLIGAARARDLVMTGRRIDAREALDWGLISRLAPREDLDAAVDAVLAELIAAGPEALRLQKRLCNDWDRVPLPQAVALGIDAFAEAYAGDEPRRMMRAFLDRKR